MEKKLSNMKMCEDEKIKKFVEELSKQSLDVDYAEILRMERENAKRFHIPFDVGIIPLV